jgi:hypothetical protein
LNLPEHISNHIKHVTLNLLVLFVVALSAIAFDVLEHRCKDWGVSPWLTNGLSFLARYAFFVDAFVFCFIVTVTGWHVACESLKRPEKP